MRDSKKPPEKRLQYKGVNLKPPYISESQLGQFEIGSIATKKKMILGEAFCVGLNGLKGSGKTATLAFYACLALAMGLDVYLNFPVAFYLKRDVTGEMVNGKYPTELLQANWIDMKGLFKLSKSLNRVFVGISEFQNWAPKYGFNSRVNRFISGWLHQLRKASISFFYDAQFEGDVDLHTGRQTDIRIDCHNLYFTDSSVTRKWERFRLTMYDESGMWTGKSHKLQPWLKPVQKVRLWFLPWKGCYDSFQVMDPFEALRLSGDDWEDIIAGEDGASGKANMRQLNYRETRDVINKLFINGERHKAKDIAAALGISSTKGEEWKDVVAMLNDMNISWHRSAYGGHYARISGDDVALSTNMTQVIK